MKDPITEILEAIARVETKIDHHNERLGEYGKRITSLEKKWWTSLGAIVLSAITYIKTLFTA